MYVYNNCSGCILLNLPLYLHTNTMVMAAIRQVMTMTVPPNSPITNGSTKVGLDEAKGGTVQRQKKVER